MKTGKIKSTVTHITESDLKVGSTFRWLEGEFCFDVMVDEITDKKVIVRRLSDNRSQSFTHKKAIKCMIIK